jgi:8-oxo-dGTP pyrophosphatase MutT (NUDIX family)
MFDESWPNLPAVRLERLEQRTESTPGFLELRRTRLRAHQPDGSTSNEFIYDSVDRRALDAVVVAAYYRKGAEVLVYLRSAVRPPVAVRNERQTPDASPQDVQFWELPAGLVEPAEQTIAGLATCARRETQEELGFELRDDDFVPMGHGIYPTPAVIPERQFFFRVEVNPESRGEPSLDGSPLEQAGVVFAAPLEQALERCRNGEILDGKTELGLRRLKEALERE